jgi:hypothetical protein
MASSLRLQRADDLRRRLADLSADTRQKRILFGSLSDPRAVVLKVHSWAALLKEGRVRSYAEIAKGEGITPARVSQLWPLSRITKEKADEALTESKGKEISLRKLIRIARNPDVKWEGLRAGDMASG